MTTFKRRQHDEPLDGRILTRSLKRPSQQLTVSGAHMLAYGQSGTKRSYQETIT
jgi:hypothetical protein